MIAKEAAARLLEAERKKLEIEPLIKTYLGFTAEDAYQTQLEVIRMKVDEGAVVVGKKIGLTSKAMQNMAGVDEPDYGHLLDNMMFLDGDTISLESYIQPKVECEIAFVLKKDLKGPDVTVLDVLEATDYVVPSIEVIDSRIENWKIKFEDTVADNGSSASAVLGSKATKLEGLDLANIGMVSYRNGEMLDTAAGAAVLGNPLRAVAWLANSVGKYGVSLRAGEVILSGALTAAIPIEAGDTFTVEFDHLGSVTVTFKR
ncbi:2-keto-4-pentenoate hydratase [Oceanobacillus arenosus]|uniref:2-keto-4-pentenoate hydratase n=1 Tax=Oceanobacillus arenosus TaxID=1229153 RepID=A0A3D8PXY0_9BACI|nr:2-keto-4-pentenoate hydratase [Oceanobacillus arenosus]RDW20118.1 2-keto-4-pentenoate hydratase [Oceanobacillus arenosus]